MNERNQLDGIEGWLIIVAIGLVIAPFRSAVMMYQTYPEVLEPMVWNALTTPGGDAYHPLWGPIISAEILINAGLMVMWIIVAYKFFTKSASFTRWFIFMAIASVVFILVDALAIKLVLPNEPLFDADTTKILIQSVIFAAIWIPYMLVSKRVKATFGSRSQDLSIDAKKGAQIMKSILDVLIACALGAISGFVAAYLGYPQFGIFLALIVVTGYMVNTRRR